MLKYIKSFFNSTPEPSPIPLPPPLPPPYPPKRPIINEETKKVKFLM